MYHDQLGEFVSSRLGSVQLTSPFGTPKQSLSTARCLPLFLALYTYRKTKHLTLLQAFTLH